MKNKRGKLRVSCWEFLSSDRKNEVIGVVLLDRVLTNLTTTLPSHLSTYRLT